MSVEPVTRWIVCIAGWQQNEGQTTGLEELQDRLHRRCSNRSTRVVLRAWNDSPSHIAERIFRRRPNDGQPAVVIIGYSYGGYSAVLLARQLQRRGIEVETMLLCDAVWRPSRWCPSVLSLLPWWTLRVPGNVRRLYSWRQKTNKPSGHAIALEDTSTLWSTRSVVGTTHRYMDENPEFVSISIAKGCPEKQRKLETFQ